MTPQNGRKKPPRTYTRTGFHAAKRAIQRFGQGAIDGRSKAARAVRQWREQLLQDLGGEDNVTTQQATILDVASRTKYLLDSLDGILLTLPHFVNKRNWGVLPIVRERGLEADRLVRYLTLLGLERKARPVKTLEAHVAERYGTSLPGDETVPVPRQVAVEASGAVSPSSPPAASLDENGGKGGKHGDSDLAKRSGSVPV